MAILSRKEISHRYYIKHKKEILAKAKIYNASAIADYPINMKEHFNWRY